MVVISFFISVFFSFIVIFFMYFPINKDWLARRNHQAQEIEHDRKPRKARSRNKSDNWEDLDTVIFDDDEL